MWTESWGLEVVLRGWGDITRRGKNGCQTGKTIRCPGQAFSFSLDVFTFLFLPAYPYPCPISALFVLGVGGTY